ncbi:MAG: formyltetrahydrofolate deformylase [Chloroflexales bacterium]|nr:formyltetrahydrofolate deformylase [Chloroflexales bacterium]
MNSHILLIDCPDQTGLVYHITGALYRHGYNIVANSEFVDRASGQFFMRTVFAGERAPHPVLDALRAALPPAATLRLAQPGAKRVVVLATREHHCLGDLLIRHAYGELSAQIVAVIANHATLGPLVRRFDLPFHHVPHQALSREQHEAQVLALVAGYAPDYLVLAKYMRVLTPAFVARYSGRIVNIHHSFLPAFVGASPYKQAFERGVKIIGATAHLVSDTLDEGPIIAQGVIPVDHTQSAADMAQAGRDVEKTVLARALRLVFEEHVFVSGNKTIILD